MTTPITFTTGQENTSLGSTKANAYKLATDTGAKALRRAYDESATRALAEVAAVRDKKRAIVGVWSTYCVNADDGDYLAFGVVRNNAKLSSRRGAMLFVRVREEAAYRKITVPTIGCDGASKNEVSIEGRFDIVDLDEVSTMLKLPLQLQQAHELQDSTFSRVEVLEAEIAPRPVIKTKDVRVNGETRRIVVRKKTRKLGLT